MSHMAELNGAHCMWYSIMIVEGIEIENITNLINWHKCNLNTGLQTLGFIGLQASSATFRVTTR